MADTLKNNPVLMDELLVALSHANGIQPPFVIMRDHLHALILSWVQHLEAEKEQV